MGTGDPRQDRDKIFGIVQAEGMEPIPIYKPWGDFNPRSGSSVSVAGGASETLASYSGKGWVFAVIAKFNSNLFRLDIQKDGNLIYPNMTIQEMFDDFGLENQANLPFVTAYDSTNNEFAVTFDPPNFLYFNSSVTVSAVNTDTSGHTINKYSVSIIEYK